jgi:hypothetical protein
VRVSDIRAELEQDCITRLEQEQEQRIAMSKAEGQNSLLTNVNDGHLKAVQDKTTLFEDRGMYV